METSINNQEEQDFSIVVKTVSWRNFRLKASNFQEAYQKASTTWNDYLPDGEYLVMLDIIPDSISNDRAPWPLQ